MTRDEAMNLMEVMQTSDPDMHIQVNMTGSGDNFSLYGNCTWHDDEGRRVYRAFNSIRDSDDWVRWLQANRPR